MQLLARPRHPGHLAFGKARGLDQRVAPAQAVGHLFVEQPLADAIAGHGQFGGRKAFGQLRQHRRGQRHQLHPRGRDIHPRAQIVQIAGRDPGHGVGDRLGRHAVFVQDSHRIGGAFHVQTGDGAPRSAHQIDALVMGAHDLGQPRHHLLDVLAQSVLAAGYLLQPERPQRRRHPLADLAVRDLGQFHRVAADVADQAPGIGPSQQHPLGRQARLFLAVDDMHADAGFAFDAGLKGGAVLGLAHRGGGHAGQGLDPHAPSQRGKALQGGKAPLDPLGVQAAGLGHPGAQPGHDLFVVEIGGRAGRAVEHHHADRVRSDIDHAHARQGPFRLLVEFLAERLDLLAGRGAQAVHRRPLCAMSPPLMNRPDGQVNQSNG